MFFTQWQEATRVAYQRQRSLEFMIGNAATCNLGVGAHRIDGRDRH